MPISLEGKTAIVTCGSFGIGRVIAQRFLNAGARVMLADLDERPADEERLSGDESRHARFHYTVQDRLCVANLIASTVDRFDQIDILVNAVQIAGPPTPILDLEMDAFDAALGENVSNILLLSQAVAKRMVAQPGEGEAPAGAIVNVSSIAGQRTGAEQLVQSVCAAAIDQLTRSMAVGLAANRIRVNAIALGGVMSQDLRETLRDDEARRAAMIGASPLARLGEAEEAADAALFLASDHAGFVTGQVLAVDGGRTLLDPMSSPVW